MLSVTNPHCWITVEVNIIGRSFLAWLSNSLFHKWIIIKIYHSDHRLQELECREQKVESWNSSWGSKNIFLIHIFKKKIVKYYILWETRILDIRFWYHHLHPTTNDLNSLNYSSTQRRKKHRQISSTNGFLHAKKGIKTAATSQISGNKMFSPEYEKRLLKHCSPTARRLFDAPESSSPSDRFIPCRFVLLTQFLLIICFPIINFVDLIHIYMIVVFLQRQQ